MPGVAAGITDQTPDMGKLLEIAAQYLDMPEVQSLLRPISPEEQEMASGGGEARQSPTTTRNYVRHGAPGPNSAGKANQAMQMMGASDGE